MAMSDVEDDFDDEDKQDDINTYNDDSDEDSFGEEEEKTKLLSKKQKQLISFQSLVRNAKQHFNNSEFLHFQQDLKLINDEIIKNKWKAKDFQMPKYFVKHFCEIQHALTALDARTEKNQKEQRALKSLKKNFSKDLLHFNQLQVYEQSPDFWKGQESDLGEADDAGAYDEDTDDDEDEDALYKLQDARHSPTKKSGQENEDKEDRDDGNADGAGGADDVPGFDDDDDGDGDDDADAGGGERKRDSDDSEDEDDDGGGGAEDEDDSWSSYDRRDGGDGDDDEEDDDDEDDKDDEDEEAGAAGDDAVGMEAATAGQIDDYLKQALSAFDEETLAEMRNRSFWVKQSTKKKKLATAKEKRQRTRMAKTDTKKDGGGGGDGDGEDKTAKAAEDDKKAAKEKKEKRVPRERHTAKWSVSRIREVFADVLSNRGKSGVNREQIVSRLEELQEQCELHGADQARLTVISVLISFYFETAERKTSGMSGSRWRNTRTLLTQMLRSLSKNIETLRMSTDADLKLTLKEDKKEDETGEEQTNVAWMQAIKSVEATDGGGGGIRPGASADAGAGEKSVRFGGDFNLSVIQFNNKKKKLDSKYQWIQGNVLNFIKKLSNELWTNLKALEPRSEQYDNRRKNIALLLKTYKQAVFYFSKLADSDAQSEVEVLWMHAIHNDYDESLDGVLEQQQQQTEAKTKGANSASLKFSKKNVWFRGHKIVNLPQCEVTRKAIYVFEFGSTRDQTQAMLYLIFSMALHHRFELCRDLLLMSHLGSSTRIGGTHIELQVLYNRALAQFAICSFCGGHWYAAMIILQEMFASNRLKILLGQGYIKAPQEQASSEEIKAQQEQYARMLPYHFHIHMDALEASHLLSSLFIEIPNMISNAYNKSWIRNQYFRKIWHQYLRRDLRVPPENTKDYILSTGIHAHNGEWLLCKNLVNKLKVWHEIKHPKLVKKRVYGTLKRQCLRCYLYRYGSVYDTISIATLSEMFELSLSHCKQFIAKLIVTAGNDARFASIDELTQCVVIHHKPPMPVQRTALEFSDKLTVLIEQNEKLLGIYSRFSAWGGGKSKSSGKGKGDDGGKFGGKKGVDKKQAGQRSSKPGGRFGRGAGGHNTSASASNYNAGSQFGGRQRVQTQIRSVRPRM